MRRKLAVLLALCVAVSAAWIPAGAGTVRAAEAQTAESQKSTEGDFEYEELANGDLKVIKYTGDATELAIPSEIYGNKVVQIGAEAFSGCSQLESIVIPKSVRKLGNSEDEARGCRESFSGCHNLTEIIVEEGNVWYSSQNGILYDKEKMSLLYCPKGKEGSITIPASVTSVTSAGGIDDCRNLTEIMVEDGNESYSSRDGLLYDKSGTYLLRCPEGKQGSIVLPDNVGGIGSAFHNCSNLTNITIPQNVTQIAEKAFFECDNLMDIVVDEKNETYISSDGVLYARNWYEGVMVQEGMFLICCPAGKRGSVEIPDNVECIGRFAFHNCGDLTSVIISKSVKYINYTNISSEQGDECLVFEGCAGLEEIIVDSENEAYSSQDGVLYKNIEGREKILVLCPAGKE